jgi:L-fucose mutarotase
MLNLAGLAAQFRRHMQLTGGVVKLERYDFYERSRRAYAVVQTGEERQYGNLILVKGVVL